MKFILLLSLIFACSKKIEPLKYTKEELLSIALKADSSVSFKLPKNMNEGIQCSDYPEGCLSGHMVAVKRLDFIAVEFATEEQARFAARKYRGFYVRNWFFDDVNGEPILEKFVTTALEAKRP